MANSNRLVGTFWTLVLSMLLVACVREQPSVPNSKPKKLDDRKTKSDLESKDVVLGADEWCPFACSVGKEGFKGFSVDLIEAALKLKGWNPIYKIASFPRVVENIKMGQWHGLPATDRNFTPELIITNQAVVNANWVFVVRKGFSWKYEGVESLKKIRLGIIDGYVYSPEVDKYIKSNGKSNRVQALSGATPQLQNIKKLLSQRIDAYLGEKEVAFFWARKNGVLDEIEVAGVDFVSPLFVGLGQKDPRAKQLAADIDQGILELRKNGTFKKLLKKYNISKF